MKFNKKINDSLPCKITEIIHANNPPHLFLANKKWKFGTVDEWRVRNDEKILFTCQEDDNSLIQKNLETLKSKTIIDITIKYSDIFFEFSDGTVLEVFVTSPYDAWTFDFGDIMFIPDTYLSTKEQLEMFDGK